MHTILHVVLTLLSLILSGTRDSIGHGRRGLFSKYGEEVSVMSKVEMGPHKGWGVANSTASIQLLCFFFELAK